jgi:tetratricopeptide (TPR) repeat protein
MKRLDPIVAMYAVLAWFQQRSRSLIRLISRSYEAMVVGILSAGGLLSKPFKAFAGIRESLLFQSVAGFLFGLIDAPRERLSRKPQRETSGRSYGLFLAFVSVPKEFWNKPALRRMRRGRAAQQFGKLVAFVSRVSFVEPMKWLVHVAGLLARWSRTRAWRRILVTSIPSLIVLLGSLTVWYMSRNNRFALADHYLQLADAEFLQSQAPSSTVTNGNPLNSNLQSDLPNFHYETPVTASPSKLTSYGVLLFRRVRAMHSGNQGSLVIGSQMFNRGAIDSAYKELIKIAPEQRVGDPRAHALVAMIYLNESDRRADPELLGRFRHHAEASLRSGQIPMIVVRALAGLQMMVGETDQALQVLQMAAQQDPSLYLTIVEQATAMGREPVAASARNKGVYRLSELLKADPSNQEILAQWAILVSQDEAGIKEAIDVLSKHPKVLTSRVLSRSLSEVLRLKFSNQFQRDNDLIEAMPSLDRAFSIDPTNPNFPAQISSIIGNILESSEGKPIAFSQLEESLNQLLVSGKASVATHAVCAEICRGKGRTEREVMHLQQVARSAPASAYYVNRLVRSLVQVGQEQEAERIANNSLSILQERDLLGETHVDDLMDGLGEIYQKLGRPEEAIRVFELSLGYNPSRTETRSKLVAVYSLTGDQTKADNHRQAIAASEKIHQQQRLLKNWAASKNQLTSPSSSTTVQ